MWCGEKGEGLLVEGKNDTLEVLGELGGDILKLGEGLSGQVTRLADLLKEVLVVGDQVGDEGTLVLADTVDGDLVEETVDTGEDDGNLVLNGEGLVLGLLEQLGKTGTTVQQELGGGIQIGTELGEGGDLTVLSEVQLHGTSNLLHGLGLGVGSDTGDGKTDVNGGADTLEEQLSLQEDLTVSNRNDVGGNVGRDISSLGLNDGESGHGTTTELAVHLGRTLQKTGVKVEDITGVSLTTWGTTKQKGHLTVGDGLLGQIVKDDQGVLAVVTEVLSDSASREGSEVLKRGGLGGGGSDDDGVLHGIVLLEGLDELGDGGTLLTNGNVDTVQLLGLIRAIVPLLLVKNGVEGDGGLSGLTITNNQLTLTTTNGDHGVNALDTGQHGLTDGLTGENTGGLDLSTAALRGGNGTLSIDGVTESIDDTAQKSLTDGEIDNVTGTLDGITLANETIVTENDNTDVVGLQVHGHTLLFPNAKLDNAKALEMQGSGDRVDLVTPNDVQQVSENS